MRRSSDEEVPDMPDRFLRISRTTPILPEPVELRMGRFHHSSTGCVSRDDTGVHQKMEFSAFFYTNTWGCSRRLPGLGVLCSSPPSIDCQSGKMSPIGPYSSNLASSEDINRPACSRSRSENSRDWTFDRMLFLPDMLRPPTARRSISSIYL